MHSSHSVLYTFTFSSFFLTFTSASVNSVTGLQVTPGHGFHLAPLPIPKSLYTVFSKCLLNEKDSELMRLLIFPGHYLHILSHYSAGKH